MVFIMRKMINKKRLIFDSVKKKYPYSIIKKIMKMQFTIHLCAVDRKEYYIIQFNGNDVVELRYPKTEYVLSAQFELKKDWTLWQEHVKNKT